MNMNEKENSLHPDIENHLTLNQPFFSLLSFTHSLEVLSFTIQNVIHKKNSQVLMIQWNSRGKNRWRLYH